MDAWFVGYTSNLVVGVYVGHDEPQSLGRYETGSKTAMPIFKSFIKKAIKKGDARPFKVSKNIKFLVVDQKTGRKADFLSKSTIIEAFKKNDLTKNLINNENLNLKVDKNNILKFY
jgi:penicillin-binding protein 1A